MSDDSPRLAETVVSATPADTHSSSLRPIGAGKLAGRYELLGLIGVGGMGSVYRARDTELDELVAVKVLRRDLGADQQMLTRFRQEVKLARKVTHTGVARTFDLGEHEGERFITMELVPGESLAATIAANGGLSFTRFSDIAMQICSALAAAHAAGVIHRDLKPDNVILTPNGRAVITDFGIARAAAEGNALRTLGGAVGTPAYMAPEQIEAKPDIDGRADIYALGAMMFELLTGEQPWKGETIFAIAAARLTQPPPDPQKIRADIPDVVANLVMRCMARRPEDRPQTVEDVATKIATVTLPAARSAPSIVPVRINDTPAATLKTVAVLPFQNGGAEDYLVEGLTDDLIDTLSMTSGLRVRPRSAVAHLQGTTRDARDVGRELGVQVVVEGSVRVRANDQLRVSSRLLSVSDGFQIWAQRWDGTRADVLKIGDDAARAIATALTVQQQPTRAPISDAEAIDLYLRARHEFMKFGPASILRSVDLFEQAHLRAPEDPMILAGYALAISRLLSMPVAGDRKLADARAIAEKALQVAPDAGEALIAMSAVELHANRIELSAKFMGQAAARAPLLPDVAERVAMLVCETGPASFAISRAQRALSLEPRFAYLHYLIARLYALDGDWTLADEWTTKPRREGSDENVHWIGRVRMAAWRQDRKHVEAVLADANKSEFMLKPMLVMLCDTLIRGVVGPVVHDVFIQMTQMIPKTDRGRATFYQIAAEVSASVGDEQGALAALKSAVDNGLFDLEWFDKCSLFLSYRTDERFRQMRALVLVRANAIRSALGIPPAL